MFPEPVTDISPLRNPYIRDDPSSFYFLAFLRFYRKQNIVLIHAELCFKFCSSNIGMQVSTESPPSGLSETSVSFDNS